MLLYITIFENTDKKVIIEQKNIMIIDQDRPLLPAVLGEGIPFRIMQFTIILF